MRPSSTNSMQPTLDGHRWKCSTLLMLALCVAMSGCALGVGVTGHGTLDTDSRYGAELMGVLTVGVVPPRETGTLAVHEGLGVATRSDEPVALTGTVSADYVCLPFQERSSGWSAGGRLRGRSGELGVGMGGAFLFSPGGVSQSYTNNFLQSFTMGPDVEVLAGYGDKAAAATFASGFTLQWTLIWNPFWEPWGPWTFNYSGLSLG